MPDGRTAVSLVRLGDLLTDPVRNGYSPVCGDVPTGCWVLGLGALGESGLDVAQIKPAPPDDPRVDGSVLRTGDFLVSRSNTRDKVGRVALWRDEVECCSYPDLMMRFRVDNSRVSLNYLEAFLRSPAARRHLESSASGTSGSMVKITRRAVETLLVPLPPLNDQERTAYILSTWDSAIEAVATLSRMKRAQLDWASRGLLERRSVPAMRRTTLGAVAEVRSGNTPSKSMQGFWEGTHPWVSARDMKSLVITDSARHLTDHGYSVASVAPRNSLLVLTRGMTLFKDVPVCIADQDVAFNQDVKALVIEAETNAAYVALLLRTRRNDLLGLVDSAGHGTGRLNTQALREFPIHLPPREGQDEIVETLLTAHREIEVLQRLRAAYETQKRALMTVLFSNERGDS